MFTHLLTWFKLQIFQSFKFFSLFITVFRYYYIWEHAVKHAFFNVTLHLIEFEFFAVGSILCKKTNANKYSNLAHGYKIVVDL
jgi:hypothetical protein